jgi:transcriptional regulator with XRE-family HTH domain
MDAKTFGERVKAARAAAGLTQVQLAQKAGIGQFATVLSELSPDNRRRLLGLARSLLADQAKPSIANPFPAVPKPVVKIGQKAS